MPVLLTAVLFFSSPLKEKGSGLYETRLQTPCFQPGEREQGIVFCVERLQVQSSGWAAQSPVTEKDTNKPAGRARTAEDRNLSARLQIQRRLSRKAIFHNNPGTAPQEQPFTGKRHSHPCDLYMGRKDVSIKSVNDSLYPKFLSRLWSQFRASSNLCLGVTSVGLTSLWP